MKKGLLHHIEIYVENLQESIQFWGWFLEGLGYTEFQKWSEGISWKLGDTYLVFVQAKEKYLDVPYHRCRPGLNHLAFHAESPEHVDRVHQKLKNRKVNVLYQDRHPNPKDKNTYAIYFEDPQRIKVELVATTGEKI